MPVLSHKFSDYERNGDGFLDYEEFISPLMMKFKIQNPQSVRGSFSEADTDGKYSTIFFETQYRIFSLDNVPVYC